MAKAKLYCSNDSSFLSVNQCIDCDFLLCKGKKWKVLVRSSIGKQNVSSIGFVESTLNPTYNVFNHSALVKTAACKNKKFAIVLDFAMNLKWHPSKWLSCKVQQKPLVGYTYIAMELTIDFNLTTESTVTNCF